MVERLYDTSARHQVSGRQSTIELRWLEERTQYAEGLSPSAIAQELNRKGIPGPRGLKWRDTAIRGHVDRGTGILNNEHYRGRIIFNRRNSTRPDMNGSRIIPL
ncbi:hypothetical protein AU381_21990 [Sinorhizobium glycinis]|uniref:Recombinase domain-containing protein n=1 Tax=Sinorhizobium glycinis TaxID=1472378 RepID=A0A178XTZ9_9HYPH|nr:recombinase family protein [Sinorhizobium glycinis]OAP38252.1 hypothetical protein AU381_21990 [Sinorhizobium glycinis]